MSSLTGFLKNAIRAISPRGIRDAIRRSKIQKENKKLYKGAPKSFCPICGKASYFAPFGTPSREKAQCVFCKSLERHRLLWLFLKERTSLFDKTNKKMLHVAAEACFADRFKEMLGENYLTADLSNPSAMVKMDITDIRYPDESFDVIMCNHVLEHVVDDAKAMREFYRTLKKGGWAILLVPIVDMDKTYEDFSITTDSEREKAFGQYDHVRRYGRDYVDRLKAAGFNVTAAKNYEFASAEEIIKCVLSENINVRGAGTEIFYCTKN